MRSQVLYRAAKLDTLDAKLEKTKTHLEAKIDKKKNHFFIIFYLCLQLGPENQHGQWSTKIHSVALFPSFQYPQPLL